MEKLTRARKRLAQNSKKGFTLVELIVVIVIIAILIAALLPAVMGAIDQANTVANEADGRTLQTAAALAALNPDTGGVREITATNLNNAITGQLGSLNTGTLFTIHLDNAGMPIGVAWTNARGTGTAREGNVGTVTGTASTLVLSAIPETGGGVTISAGAGAA